MSNYKVKRGLAYYFFPGKKYSNLNIVFVHGTGCNKDFLIATHTELEDYNVYYFDLPGHGDSEKTGYSADNYLDAIADFISDIDNVILIGHSLGGALTVGSLARKPANVIGGIVEGGALDFSYLPDDFKASVHSGVVPKDVVYAGFGHADNPDVVQAIKDMEPDEVTLEDWLIDEVIDVSAGIEDISVPVKVVVGREDSLVPVVKSEEIASRVPTADLLVVHGTLHMNIVARKEDLPWLVEKVVDDAGFELK